MVKQYKADHNDVGKIERGKWRKYNPYNPYVEEDEKEKSDVKIDTLGDLFDDETAAQNEAAQKTESLDDLFNETAETKTENKNMKQALKKENDYSYDIQKELEAKFDELFGSFDEDADN